VASRRQPSFLIPDKLLAIAYTTDDKMLRWPEYTIGWKLAYEDQENIKPLTRNPVSQIFCKLNQYAHQFLILMLI